MTFTPPRFLRPALPLWHAFQRLSAHDGIELAGFIAYTALISFFPFVIFLLALAGFFGGTEIAQNTLRTAFDTMPPEVAQTLLPIVNEIFRKEQPGLLTVGILGTIWATSAGVEALRLGILRGWGMEETRPFWRKRATSLGFVALAAVGALAAGLFVVAGPWVMGQLEHFFFFEDTLLLVIVTVLRLAIAFAVITAITGFLYSELPPITVPMRLVWRGAVFFGIGWIALASLFSLYLSHSGDYTVTYGSLGGVVITLLFMHVSTILFLLGVELNHVLVAPADRSVADLIASETESA